MLTPFFLSTTAALPYVIRPNITDLFTTTLSLDYTDTLHIIFNSQSGFFSFSNDSSLLINIASHCTIPNSSSCSWSHASSSGVYVMPPSFFVAEVLPRCSVSVEISVGYLSDLGCAEVVSGEVAGKDENDTCFIRAPNGGYFLWVNESLLNGRFRPLSCDPTRLFPASFGNGRLSARMQSAKRQYEMRAQVGRLTRGLYEMQAGDYVNLVFANPHGFVVVSEPAGLYYVNVGSGCTSAVSQECVWFHSALPGMYVLMGRQPAIGQVVAVSAGIFQLTIGYFDRGCCESVDGRSELQMSVIWPVSSSASACFVHTARTGALEVSRVILGPDQLIRGYDFHSRQKDVEVSLTGMAISGDDGIGALILDNSRSDDRSVFYYIVTVTDPADTRASIDALPFSRVRTFDLPTMAIGEEYLFANRTLHAGGCLGLFCLSGATELGGNTDGVRSTSDGDPIYESDEEKPTASIALAVVIVLAVLGFGMLLACWWWHKNLQTPDPELMRPIEIGEEAMPPGIAAPMISDAYEIPIKHDLSDPPEPPPSVDETDLDSPYGGVPLAYPVEAGVMPQREPP
jgi:hypothetical protein